MIKTGQIDPKVTPDTERALPQSKQASSSDQQKTKEQLDNDVMKRLSDRAARC